MAPTAFGGGGCCLNPVIVGVPSLDDPRLEVYSKLTDVELRSRIEPEQGVFIAESVEVISRALDAKMVPISMLMTARLLGAIYDTGLIRRIVEANNRAKVFVAPDEELEKLTGFELTRGALAAFRRPKERAAADVLSKAKLVVVLEDIRNHTNVGAAFRSAAALGADAVLVTPACYDPFYRRAIRVSMGTVFQVPWARIGTDAHNWARDGVPLLHDLGFTTCAMALSDDSISLSDPSLHECEKLALVFGTEGDGLAKSTLAQCDRVVRIPMQHGVDSLNVAASVAVALWEFRR